jgi:hypothetical protein
MYDIITTAFIFFLLVPGVVLTFPPGVSPMISAVVHAAVFYIVLRYASDYIPFWVIWVIAGGMIAYKLFAPSSTPVDSMYSPPSSF